MRQRYIQLLRGDYYDGHLWYPTLEEGILFKINVRTGKVDYVLDMMMPEEIYMYAYYQVIAMEDGTLWLSAGRGDWFLQINLQDGSQELLGVLDAYKQAGAYSKYTQSIRYKDMIYGFPGGANNVVEINTKTREMRCYENIMKEMDAMQGRTMLSYFSWGTFQKENMVYAVGEKCDLFLEMNLVTKEYRLVELENEVGVCGFDGVAIHRDRLYTTNQRGHVRVYDAKSKRFLKQLDTEKKYWLLRECDEGLLLVPAGTNNYAFYHVETEEIEEVEYPKEHQFVDGWIGKKLMTDIVEHEGYYYVVSSFCNMLTVVNKKSGEISFRPLFLGDKKALFLHFMNRDHDLVRERVQLFGTNCMDLKCFMDVLMKNN